MENYNTMDGMYINYNYGAFSPMPGGFTYANPMMSMYSRSAVQNAVCPCMMQPAAGVNSPQMWSACPYMNNNPATYGGYMRGYNSSIDNNSYGQNIYLNGINGGMTSIRTVSIEDIVD